MPIEAAGIECPRWDSAEWNPPGRLFVVRGRSPRSRGDTSLSSLSCSVEPILVFPGESDRRVLCRMSSQPNMRSWAASGSLDPRCLPPERRARRLFASDHLRQR